MILEFLAGTHPASVRMSEWLDAHPYATLGIVIACVLVGGLVEAM